MNDKTFKYALVRGQAVCCVCRKLIDVDDYSAMRISEVKKTLTQEEWCHIACMPTFPDVAARI